MKKQYGLIAVLCLVISILVWIPNLVFKTATPLILLTFIVPVIGVVFAVLGKRLWLVIGNSIMFFSLFILLGVGYWINSK